jgi:hypothetical protein
MRNSERRNSEAAQPCGRRDTPKSSAHDGRRAPIRLRSGQAVTRPTNCRRLHSA